jgi:hypothetical protein
LEEDDMNGEQTDKGGRRRWRPRIRTDAAAGAGTPARGLVVLAVFWLAVSLTLTAAGCGDSQSTAAGTGTSSATAPQGTGRSASEQPPWLRSGASSTAAETGGTERTVTSTGTSGPATGGSPTGAAPAVSTTTTTLPEGTYGDGIYLVGTDIASGLYKGTATSPAGDWPASTLASDLGATSSASHWEISWDANGERFVAAGDPVGQFYVKVTSGQYLRLRGVTITKAPTAPAENLATSDIGDGTYRVGYDIAAGWYKGAPTGSLGYWEITSDANGQSLVASDYVKGAFTLKVKSGQYLTLRGVSIGQ